jgi:hypothetical protein
MKRILCSWCAPRATTAKRSPSAPARGTTLEAIGNADRAGTGEPTWRLATALGLLLSAKGLSRDAEPVLRTALTLAELGRWRSDPDGPGS